MARRKKPGPKPLPKGVAKRHAILVKFNDAELAHVRTACRGMALSSYLRALAMAQPVAA